MNNINQEKNIENATALHAAPHFPEVIPTNTCPQTLEELSRRSENFSAFSQQVHLDVCDDVFAPGKSWPLLPEQQAELESMGIGPTRLPYVDVLSYEVHLMVKKPLSLGVAFARAGAKRVIPHVEVFPHAENAREAFEMWRLSGAKEVGVAVLMDTPLSALAPYANICDEILVMTIASVGKQGIPFDMRGVDRVRELHARYPRVTIAADGGVSEKNIALLREAGVSRFCVGSAIEKKSDPAKAYANLLQAAGA